LIENLNWFYIFLAFVLFFLYHSLDSLRLKTIAKGYGIHYSLPYAYATSFISTFGSTITPAHVGGELIIFYMLKRLGVKNHKIWGTILFKTISGLSFFVIAFPIFILYAIINEVIIKKIILLFAIFILFAIISIKRAKAFKNSAVFSEFIRISEVNDLGVEVYKNDKLVQKGNISLMMYKPEFLVSDIDKIFGLENGDIVMSGTPKGVGVVNKGDKFMGIILKNEKVLIEKEFVCS
jgi:uncharacterized protein (TIRG00374 family)